jgi:hypothetical protein
MTKHQISLLVAIASALNIQGKIIPNTVLNGLYSCIITIQYNIYLLNRRVKN